MDVVQTIQPAYSGTQTEAATAASGTGQTLSSDFETFLKMLTVQMQNQDPLNPVDSSDYAVQLATFSSVEQQVLTNDLLEGLSASLGASGMGQLANWIGMEALSQSPAQFDGTPITVVPTSRSQADASQLVVRDEFGSEVERIDLANSSDALEWSGVDENGNPMIAGKYAFSVEFFQNGSLIETANAATYSRIEEARLDASQTVLNLAGGTEISPDAVTGLRSGG